MNLPHDIRFLVHEWFMRAVRKHGLADQLLRASTASARLQVIINQALLGTRTKSQETEMIQCIAEMEIYLSQIVTALGVQNETKLAIQAKLDALTDEVLRP